MFEYELLEREQILYLNENSILKEQDKDSKIAVILTDLRLLLFKEEKGNYLEDLSSAQSRDYQKIKELILEVPRKDIAKIQEEGYYQKYILKSTNYFYLNDKELYKIVKRS